MPSSRQRDSGHSAPRNCSGFGTLFVQMKGTWDGVVRNEHRAENTRLLNDLPQELKGQTFDVEVSEQLRQLRLALEKAESACDPQQTIDEQGGDGGSKSSEPRT